MPYHNVNQNIKGLRFIPNKLVDTIFAFLFGPGLFQNESCNEIHSLNVPNSSIIMCIGIENIIKTFWSFWIKFIIVSEESVCSFNIFSNIISYSWSLLVSIKSIKLFMIVNFWKLLFQNLYIVFNFIQSTIVFVIRICGWVYKLGTPSLYYISFIEIIIFISVDNRWFSS